jgi:RNA polymerase sigma-70 factor (ECF subfamily)
VESDDDLVRGAKEGDPDAWRELYRAHAGRLVTWLGTRRHGDSALSAEDLAADAWLIAAEKVHGFHGTSEQFAGWLFGIARKLSSSTHRRSARRRTEPAVIDDTLLLPTSEASGSEGSDWVRRALDTLPPRERDVVGCIDGLGLDVAATAAALGISAVAVRVAHHRGLRRLRGSVPSGDQPALFRG